MKNYVIYILETGQIKYFWKAPPTPAAPSGLEVLLVGDDVVSSCVDTHKVVDGQLVLIE